MEQTVEHGQWMQSSLTEKPSESDEFGITSFVYRSRRPFHPERFRQLIGKRWDELFDQKEHSGWPRDLIRSVSGRKPEARAQHTLKDAGLQVSTGRNFDTEEDLKSFEAEWDERFGDRVQEIVLIGKELNQKALTEQLDSCLLSEQELTKGSEYWQNFGDEFGEEEPVEGLRA